MNLQITNKIILLIILISASSLTFFELQVAYAAPTFVAKGDMSYSQRSTTPSLPTGIQNGDILILVVETANQSITITNTGSAGSWTLLSSSPQGTGTAGGTATRITVWYAVYGGSGTIGPTLSDSGNHQFAEVFAFRNVDPNNPIGATAGGVESTADTSGSIPGASTTSVDSLILVVMGTALPDSNGSAEYSGQSNPNLANITEIEDFTRNTGTGGGISVTTGTKATIGSYGATSVTTGTATAKAMISLALNFLQTAPSQVTGLSATAVSLSQINLSWTAPSDGGSPITGYKIEQKSQGPWIVIADTGSTSTSYSDTGLVVNTTYQYRVSAINAIGTGDASTSASATTLSSATVPSMPLNLSVTFDGTNYTLSWDAPSSDGGSAITDYIIEYSQDASSWITYDDGVGTATNSILTGLAGESHYFRVFAVNAIGTSLTSNQINIVTHVSSTGTSTRNPPKIQGIGIFKINLPTEADETNQHENHFENYFKYSTESNIVDQKLYGNNIVKSGQFFDKENFDKMQHIHLNGDSKLQIQIPILDEFIGSKVEHVSLYFQNMPDKPNSETWISFDKPDGIQVSDPQKTFNKVDVSYSLENGYFWAIFNIEFEKPLSSGVLIESWHESRRPTYEFVPNIIDGDLEFSKNQSKIKRMISITMEESQTSSPSCKETHDCYIPDDAYVLEGGMVSWENNDRDFIHTITSGTPETGADNQFNGIIRPGETFYHIFSNTGVYPYHCMIHPWATGTVTVVKENSLPLEKEKVLPSEKVIQSTGTNVAGKVTIPIIEKFPLIVKSLASGKIDTINTNDIIYLESKDLKVEIIGNIGAKDPIESVKIKIIRPDNSEGIYNINAKNDGHYHLLTTLSDHWEAGHYQVLTFYGKAQIGNISFNVSDKKDGGFGGVLPNTVVTLEPWLKLIESSKFYEETGSMGWYSIKHGDEHVIFQLTTIENSDKNQEKHDTILGYNYLPLLIVMPIVVLTSIVGLVSMYRTKNHSQL